jgi:hypothetical protein
MRLLLAVVVLVLAGCANPAPADDGQHVFVDRITNLSDFSGNLSRGVMDDFTPFTAQESWHLEPHQDLAVAQPGRPAQWVSCEALSLSFQRDDAAGPRVKVGLQRPVCQAVEGQGLRVLVLPDGEPVLAFAG